MPKLSIIIPCFNCAETLEAAVLSCFDQGFTADEFEIVLVDDCSTDQTPVVIRTLEARYRNLRSLRHEQNRGGGATRNTAAAAALAPVLFCLDSDDLLPPGTLRRLYDFLSAKAADGVGVAISHKFIGSDPTNIAYTTNFTVTDGPIPLEQLLQRDGEWCSLYSVFMCTKAAFQKAGGYPTHHGFDTQGFAWRFLAAGLTAYTCPNTTYLHRIHHNHSYYLREYDAGRNNSNTQRILFEHLHLFTPEIQGLIRNYHVRDFTRNLMAEISAKDLVFLPKAERRYGHSQLEAPVPFHTPIPRNSLLGYWLRTKARLRSLFTIDSPLRILILGLIGAKDDIVARLEGPGRMRRLVAYILLRIRRWRRVGFSAHRKPQTDTIVDVVIPTVGKDRRLLTTYIDHLRSNLCEKIGTIFLVAPGNDEALRTFAKDQHCTFIDERSILGYGKEKIEYTVNGLDRRGWLFQQLLKLSGDQFVTAAEYIIVDSDTILTQPYRFHSDQGKTILYESTEWHAPYYTAFKNLFGYDAPHSLSLTSHMMLFSVEHLTTMKNEIATRHHMPWDEAYVAVCNKNNNSGISDYDTYGQWLLYNRPNAVITQPLYNRPMARSRFNQLPDLKIMTKKTCTSLSFHSYT